LFVFGSSFFILLLDPYSTFGRIISQLFRPLIIWANNGLTTILLQSGNYSLYQVEQISFVPLTFIIAIIFFYIVAVMSVKHGRLYCNTICPVGAGLGLVSKISLFHFSIEESSCSHCGICAKQCKSKCIDSKNMKIDDSRCVSCFNCLSSCKSSSIKYDFRYKKIKSSTAEKEVDNGRRTFLLVSGAVITSAAFAKTTKMLRNNDPIHSRKPIMPPGAQNINHFNKHCTACQLCVTKCPMQVLKPAALEYGFTGIMQPHLVFSTHIFCSYDCNICTTVCPTNALQKMDIETKKQNQIGIAQFRKDKCIVFTEEKDCGACSEHCPTQAVHMIPYKNGLTIPEVTENICIGCGGCESICPAKPNPAIYVEGISTQLKAKKPAEAKKFDKKIEDFGF